jgi:hypothetical protein
MIYPLSTSSLGGPFLPSRGGSFLASVEDANRTVRYARRMDHNGRATVDRVHSEDLGAFAQQSAGLGNGACRRRFIAQQLEPASTSGNRIRARIIGERLRLGLSNRCARPAQVRFKAYDRRRHSSGAQSLRDHAGTTAAPKSRVRRTHRGRRREARSSQDLGAEAGGYFVRTRWPAAVATDGDGHHFHRDHRDPRARWWRRGWSSAPASLARATAQRRSVRHWARTIPPVRVRDREGISLEPRREQVTGRRSGACAHAL